jgi:GWxTD domain-containing protein
MVPILIGSILVLVGCATAQTGIELKHAVFLRSDTTIDLELTYAVPHPGVTFIRSDSGFCARFLISVQCWEGRHRLVRMQDWVVQHSESAYEATGDSRLVVSGRRVVTLPRNRVSAEVRFQDLFSERTRTWRFAVVPPSCLSDVRLTRTARKSARGWTAAVETLTASCETYRPTSGHGPDTLVVRVVRERRTLRAQRVAVPPDSARSAHEFIFPLTDIENGEYAVSAEAFRQGRLVEQRQARFEVTNSFFASERDYQERVNQLLWIFSESELRQLRKARPVERESLWTALWRRYDETPTTEANETEQAYLERIDYAVRNFGRGDRGYRSDRARVYVRLGPPDNVDSLPFETDRYAEEIWHYYGLNLKFTFRDVSGFGEFKLVDPADYFRR